jgi:hypothetical protein
MRIGTLGMPGFSYMWVTLSVPLGGLLLLITTLRKGRDLLKIMSGVKPDEL